MLGRYSLSPAPSRIAASESGATSRRHPARSDLLHQESSMMRRGLSMLLPVLALSTALFGESAGAGQEEAIPGVAIETLGRSPVGGSGEQLALLRVTIEPGASVPTSD